MNVLVIDAPATEIVHVLYQHGQVNVCRADAVEEHVMYITGRPLEPIYCQLPFYDEPLDPEHYAQAGQPTAQDRPVRKQGGVSARYLGSGTGGLVGM
jgi:hypothetical protein